MDVDTIDEHLGRLLAGLVVTVVVAIIGLLLWVAAINIYTILEAVAKLSILVAALAVVFCYLWIVGWMVTDGIGRFRQRIAEWRN